MFLLCYVLVLLLFVYIELTQYIFIDLLLYSFDWRFGAVLFLYVVWCNKKHR